MSTNHHPQPFRGRGGRFPRSRLVLRLISQLPATLRTFWSSELNRRAVELVAPRPGEVVLDVGAGMGAGALVSAARVAPGGTVIAIDPSRVMRGVMRLRRLSPDVRQLEIRAGSAESLPVPAASVDAVYAVNAAHHFADLSQFATEVSRVLRPGGRVLLVEEDMSDPDHPFHFLVEVPGHDRSSHSPHAVDGGKLASLLASAGLESSRSTNRLVGETPATVIAASRPS